MGFLQFFESFRGKMYKKYSVGNDEWIEFETATITSCRQNECTYSVKTNSTFVFL